LLGNFLSKPANKASAVLALRSGETPLPPWDIKGGLVISVDGKT
jgi:hypothetical protein